MKNELATLKRETERLRGQLGTATLRPLYRLIDESGAETGIVDIEGRPATVGENDVVFTILEPIFRVLAEGKTFSVLSGGRGAGKSHGIARFILGLAMIQPGRWLCTREIQLSLKESVHYLFSAIIRSDPRLSDFWEIRENGISGQNGSEFLFRGLQNHTADSLKSYEDLTGCWIEEGQSISRRSLDTLVPTIRADDAQFFININPRKITDPVYEDFCIDERPDTEHRHFTLEGNPLASQRLRDDSALLKQRDHERHSHVYGGKIETRTEGRIFDNWIVDDFDIAETIEQLKRMVPHYHHLHPREARERRGMVFRTIENSWYAGSDFGFTDPFTIVLLYLDEENARIFIRHEHYKSGYGPDEMVAALKSFPKVKNGWPVSGDSARPGLIRHAQKNGIAMQPSIKLPVSDRIDALKRFSIIVHPDCENVIMELGQYSWQQDRNGTVLPVPEDRNNHTIDAIAYALGKMLDVDSTGEYHRLNDPYL